MTTEEILIVVGVALLVVVVVAGAGLLVGRRRGRERAALRARYGPEYDATVRRKGVRAGVEDLSGRAEERRSLSLDEPGDDTRADLRQRMAELQFRFVEEPEEVLLELQRIVVDGLRARGYPAAEDRERTLRLLSVDFPDQTPSLRILLDGAYGHDLALERRVFLDARAAMREVLAVSYSVRDAVEAHPAAEADTRRD